MDPKEKRACENLLELLLFLKELDEKQTKMTEEEKKRNEWGSWDGDTLLFKY